MQHIIIHKMERGNKQNRWFRCAWLNVSNLVYIQSKLAFVDGERRKEGYLDSVLDWRWKENVCVEMGWLEWAGGRKAIKTDFSSHVCTHLIEFAKYFRFINGWKVAAGRIENMSFLETWGAFYVYLHSKVKFVVKHMFEESFGISFMVKTLYSK